VIYGSSSDPVLIKKIALRVWLLRDEIESVAKKQLETAPETDKSELVTALKSEYSNDPNASGGDLIGSDDLVIADDDGEDLMAAAIAGDDDGEDLMAAAIEGDDDAEDEMAAAMAEAPAEEESGEADNQDDLAAAMEASLDTPLVDSSTNNVIYINQRYPDLDDSKVFTGRTLLGEIDIDKIFFFSSQNFPAGQSIVIDFLIPKRFRLNAQVLYCQQYSMKSRVISKNSTPFRLVAKFTFQNQGEKTLLRNFLQSIEVDIPEPEKAPQKAKQEDDDDFGELDDLGL
jgi:hypothetical protein